MKKYILTTLVLFYICLVSCGNLNRESKYKTTEEKQVAIEIPKFSADSAYRFVSEQVAFGPRVPESKAHVECMEYLVNKLQNYGAKTTVQDGSATLYNGKSISVKNIIGEFRSEAKRRVLLMSHWDSRPFADQERDAFLQKQPILGANDGASGVGVLLEVARLADSLPEDLGVDIVLFDVEDYGSPAWAGGGGGWCLGSEYWSKNPHKDGYRADFGILLDMVGAPNATFCQEAYSLLYASKIVDKVWEEAMKSGFGGYFVSRRGGTIMDDHIPVNENRKIPSIDIIQYDPNSPTGFNTHWHTQKDDMGNIDKNTLYAVGQTLLNVLCK